MTPVNRIVGDMQLVYELDVAFTHGKPMKWFSPNVPPTHKKISVGFVGVVEFRRDQLACERM